LKRPALPPSPDFAKEISSISRDWLHTPDI
jgi:hypothetical protein